MRKDIEFTETYTYIQGLKCIQINKTKARRLIEKKYKLTYRENMS